MNVWASLLGLALLAPTPTPTPTTQVRWQDDRIVESSGLVVSGSLLYTINDSPDPARVFVVDRNTGATVGVTSYGADVFDVEALALGPRNVLWVGDIGDNSSNRSHITVYRMPLPQPGDRSVRATGFDLVYPDGPRDAETLLADPLDGRLYVVSKGLLGGTIYVAPQHLRADKTNVLRPVASAPSLMTDGSFFPDGRHILMRDYSDGVLFQTSDFTEVDRFTLPQQRQGEGLALDGTTVLTSSEQAHTPVKSSPLPRRVVAELGLPTVSPSATATPTPSPTPTAIPSPTPTSSHPQPGESSDSWVMRAAPYALGAAWLMVALFAVRAFRRRTRHTQ